MPTGSGTVCLRSAVTHRGSRSQVKELLKRIASDTTGGLVEEDKPLMESGRSAWISKSNAVI